jgi:response regulator RpfG family c-di-GMP phosphodiesterase
MHHSGATTISVHSSGHQMPGMDGIELCDLLRRLPDYAECPIIIVTAMTDRKFMDRPMLPVPRIM